MKDFLKFTLASCFGLFLAMVVIGILTSIMLGVAVSSSGGGGGAQKIEKHSLLSVSFDEAPPELTNNTSSNEFDFDNPDVIGIHRIVDLIHEAADDDKIEGLFIDADAVNLGLTSARMVQEAIDSFKLSDKPVIAHANGYNQISYLLATAADEVMVSPTGWMDFRGFASVNPFVTDMLSAIGVKMNIYYAGDYKSATEMFRRTDMSEENREQTKAFLEDMYNLYLSDIASHRDLTVAELRQLANNLDILNPERAREAGMIDVLGYQTDAMTRFRTLLDKDDDDKLYLVDLDSYNAGYDPEREGDRDQRVAVVFAEGEINDSKGDPGVISGDAYGRLLKKLRKDDKVKAVVLRVNSPGGSVIASDEIWQEVERLQDAGKPVVVSMGEYAASGGYYISCGADKIYSEPTTLTGSIGVFAMFPNIRGLMNDKLHVTFDTVSTGKYAARMNGIYDPNQEEAAIYQRMVDNYYQTFLTRVAEGRNMTVDEVHEIAQGRVWTGERAVKNGLVDELGDLEMAIEEAASLAEVEDYRLYTYPRTKNPLQKMIENLTGQGSNVSSTITKEIDAIVPGYKAVKSAIDQKTPQARMTLELQY